MIALVGPCPSCGVFVTMEREPDAAVFTARRHSRRAPARLGLGEIVWCEGGTVARAVVEAHHARWCR